MRNKIVIIFALTIISCIICGFDTPNTLPEVNPDAPVQNEVIQPESGDMQILPEQPTRITQKEEYKDLIESYPQVEYILPHNTGFKSFMDYHAITYKSSKQYELQQKCTTNYRGLRMINDRYCIAVGTFFGAEVGQCLDATLENGTIIRCVVADIKADKDTDIDNIFTTKNGCCLEFVVDRSVLSDITNEKGDISLIYPNWNSPVYTFNVYDLYIQDIKNLSF